MLITIGRFLHKSVDYSNYITEPGQEIMEWYNLRPRDKSKEIGPNFGLSTKPKNSLERVYGIFCYNV